MGLFSKGLKTFSIIIFLSNYAAATTSFSLSVCNTKFNGVIDAISPSHAPFSFSKRVKIIFNVYEAIRGIESDQSHYEVEVVQSSSDHFKIGDEIKVTAHDGLVCALENEH